MNPALLAKLDLNRTIVECKADHALGRKLAA